MWLLSTDRAELYYCIGPEAISEPGYAILSHVWSEDEETFQDLQDMRIECDELREPRSSSHYPTEKAWRRRGGYSTKLEEAQERHGLSGRNPRDLACSKIRECCLLAERHGYKWVWIDTCCIDKTSSSELSEAINSMYRYYALSAVCYAYLADVRTGRTSRLGQESWRARLNRGRWYERGWTLQELIAPPFLLFVSQSWDVLGSKYDLAENVEENTRVPASLLRMESRLSDFSVAQRMSWASSRKTTRLEDEAYSLLGIFDVNMPTLYGEGRKAFRRLQEEIMKQSPDTTLFAWDVPHQDALFATRPSDFSSCRHVRYRSPGPSSESSAQYSMTTLVAGKSSRAPIRTFTLTPHGVLAHMPLAFVPHLSPQIIAGLGLSYDGRIEPDVHGLWVADLSWYRHEDTRSSPNEPGRSPPEDSIFLLLTERNLSDHDSDRRFFSVGDASASSSILCYIRRRVQASMPASCRIEMMSSLTWREIYLNAHAVTMEPHTVINNPSTLFPTNRGMNPPFRIFASHIYDPDSMNGIRWIALSDGAQAVSFQTRWPSAASAYQCPGLDRTFRTVLVVLGVCVLPCQRDRQSRIGDRIQVPPYLQESRSHWAKLVGIPYDPLSSQQAELSYRNGHECTRDHITDLGIKEAPARTLVLGNDKCPWSVDLWFTRCPISPRTTIVPHTHVNVPSPPNEFRIDRTVTDETN